MITLVCFSFGWFVCIFGSQWQAKADAAKSKTCYWRFVLLQVTILHADILSDGIVGEMAEIEALIKEAAELVDESQPKNQKYCR